MNSLRLRLLIVHAGLLLLYPLSAHAYVGPGLGLGVVGAVLGVVVSMVVALAAIVWYPLKKLLGRGGTKPIETVETEDRPPGP